MTERRLRSVAADLLYQDGRFHRGRALEIAPDGRIAVVSPGTRAELRLDGAALLPGFVNAHSHAFQRAIRGRTTGPASAGADFWGWRDAMYAAANALDDEAIYEASFAAYREMAAAGYTAVGEFHYLHRDPDGRAYADPNHLAKRVARAALDAGLRIVLLDTAYERAGVDTEGLAVEQRRFGTDGGVAGSISNVERLAAEWVGEPLASVGVAAHSVRAVPPASLRAIAAWSARAGRDRPVHIHLSEQRAEVEDCLRAYGCRPVQHAARCGILGPETTAVHGTHVDAEEIATLAESETRVCVCPTTEADLGDGLVPASDLARAGVPLCLGTDSHVRVDPFEEMRRLETHERLRLERRDALLPERAGSTLGAALLDVATREGAASLRLPAGALRAGAWADFVAVDLTHPVLDGWEQETLPDGLALAADPRVVVGVWVAGRRVWLRR